MTQFRHVTQVAICSAPHSQPQLMVFSSLNLGQHQRDTVRKAYLSSPGTRSAHISGVRMQDQETFCSFLKSDFDYLSAVGPQLSVVAGIPGIAHPSTDSRQPSGGQTEDQAFYSLSCRCQSCRPIFA